MRSTIAVAVMLCLPVAAVAQGFPNRPIKLIVPLAAAGTGDTLARTVGEGMAKELRRQPGAQLAIDLPAQTLALPDGRVERFEVDAFRKECLVAGIDEIELTLRYEKDIARHEQRQRAQTPWLAASKDRGT